MREFGTNVVGGCTPGKGGQDVEGIHVHDTVAEVVGSDLSISGIRNELRVITDFAQYDMRINPNNENELFLPPRRRVCHPCHVQPCSRA